MKPVWPDDGIILFDDECVLCSGWAQFVARRDVDGRFRFTAIKSGYGRRLAAALGISVNDPDTNAVIVGGKVFLRSDATIAVLGALPGWRWTGVLRFVPRAVRNPVYTLVATHRYRWFGRREHCELSFSKVGNRLLS